MHSDFPSQSRDTIVSPEDRTDEAALDEDPFALIPGTDIQGRYRVLAKLGSGGMGVVYRARHLALGHEVAIKVMRGPQRDVRQSRFVREAQLASRVHHPHTVYVSDVGELADGRFFLAMELLQGRTLRTALAQSGGMEPLRVCRIGAMIASGMQSVHQAGIVHRDLKPANIFLLDQEGTTDFVKIVDFGVAREVSLPESAEATVTGTPTDPEDGSDTLAEQAALTRQGAVVGTPRYMAPEQLRGEPLDARADQYALGCVLYELLTSTSPFSGSAQDITRGHLYGELVPPRQLRPEAGISKQLESIVLRAMARRREARFPEMRALADSLHAEAERLRGKLRGLRWLPGRRALLGALAVGVVAMATIKETAPVPQLPAAVPLMPAAVPLMPATVPLMPAAVPSLAHTSAVALVSSPIQSAPAPAVLSERSSTPLAPAIHARAATESVGDLLARAATAIKEDERYTAQLLLQRARARCASPGSAPAECAAAAAPILLYLGRIKEAEGHWAEALAEYTKARTVATGKQLAFATEADAAVTRLMPRLGRVLVSRQRSGRCEEVPIFLPAGKHQLEINGQSQPITVFANQTQRLGSCLLP